MKQTALFTPVLIAGCIIVMLSFAVRASFGVFQIPVAEEFGWLRSEFSMAIALQNLFWGIGQPIFGAIASLFFTDYSEASGFLNQEYLIHLLIFGLTPSIFVALVPIKPMKRLKYLDTQSVLGSY
jgi:glucan phosphoethanolaminetransferase (alkaline phosphatase superfamily)